MPSRRALCTLTAMSWLFFGMLAEARAQSATPASVPNSPVRVTLAGSRPGLALSIQSENDARYLQRCEGSCDLLVVPGLYRVSVVENGESSSRRIKIREPQRLTLTPPNHDTRDVGTGLAIGGLALGGLGSVAFLYGVARALPCAYGEEPGSACPEHAATLVFVGLGGMAAGLALGIPGIVLAVKNSRPAVEVEKYGMATSRRWPTLYFGALGAGVPMGLRLRGEF